MAGGAAAESNNSQSPISQVLQNYPIAPNTAGGAQASGAAMPTAQGVSQLQQMLQRMGAGGMNSPAMQMANGGMQLAKMGQPQAAMAPPPMARAGAPMPFQGAMPPIMGAGQGLPIQGGGLPWQAMLQRGGGLF